MAEQLSLLNGATDSKQTGQPAHQSLKNVQPLAYRMRPRKIEEVIGQSHLIGDGKPISMMVAANTLSSMLLYGPPGIGKTSIAQALAGSTNRRFIYFNAANGTKADLQNALGVAKTEPIVLFVDEIHRLDHPKVDLLLASVEDGSVTLIGATTENPFINLPPALRSRMVIYELRPLTKAEILTGLKHALADTDRGLGNYEAAKNIDESKLDYLADRTNGDLRLALSSLEILVKSGAPFDEEHIDATLGAGASKIDNGEDGHYDTIAWYCEAIKSSDVNAALLALGVLLNGNDMESAIRRIEVGLFEDIGVANMKLWTPVIDALQVARDVGLPKAQSVLSAVTVAMCLSPKANASTKAIEFAREDAAKDNWRQPDMTRDMHYKGALSMGHGVGFVSAHQFPEHFWGQGLMPKGMENKTYYRPDTKAEAKFRQVNDALRAKMYPNAPKTKPLSADERGCEPKK